MKKSLITLVGGAIITYAGASSYYDARHTYDSLRLNSSIVTMSLGVPTTVISIGFLINDSRKGSYKNKNYREHSPSVQ